MNESGRNSLIGGGVLALFALTAALLVAFTYDNSKDRIAANEKAALLASLHALVPASRHDNDLFLDAISERAETLNRRQPARIYRARLAGEPVAAIFEVVSPKGYNGEIKILVAINYNGELAGVRVVRHRETPGLGDGIEERRSNWIHQFDGKSLGHPDIKQWRVKKDGGVFDQLTGATITPRAIVDAVRQALLHYREHRDALFSRPSEASS